MKRLIPVVLVALLALPTLAASPPPAGPDLVRGLASLRAAGPWLTVHRTADAVTVADPASAWVLLVAHERGLDRQGPDGLRYPDPGRAAATIVARDDAGATVYTHSLTADGARVTIFSPGRINAEGLHVIAFDNDDVHIQDGASELVYFRGTEDDGTLVERQGARYGCGCERRTAPDGRVSIRPL